MTASINVIVTCTKRKSVTVPDPLKFRAMPNLKLTTKAKRWQQRLQASSAEPIQVRNLYSGDHWSVVRSLEDVKGSCGSKIQLWVASAGYGLVSLDDRIKPYSATFSNDHPDSIAGRSMVVERREVVQDWWRLMSQWSGEQSTGLQSITDIATEWPRSPLLVVASTNYLQAMGDDLSNAVECLSDPDLLSIISAGCKSLDGLSLHLVPSDARLQQVVGGALSSLNVRIVRMAIAKNSRSLPTLPVLRRKFNRLLREQPSPERIKRQALSDESVRRFIESELRDDERACHTPLLKKLRDEGKACEQSRFAAIYRDVRGQFDGS